MKLLVAGSWIGGKGIYKANISKLTFLDDLEKLPTEGFYFLLVSYQVARQTTGVWVKTSSLPPIAVLHLDGFQAVDVKENQADLIFLESSMSDQEFMKGVNLLKGFIEKGTLYQANLSNKFTFELTGKPSGLFLEFYKRQPVDYAFFFECEEFYVISGSMELFLEKKGNKLISKPIKGTSLSAQDLKRSEKDRAENLMITDMVRNDLGRIGSHVEVKELFKIKKYKTLYQMYSAVECKTSASLKEILLATFPPASITGAPKIKAVEIIDRLEPHSRDFYCGCAGLVRGNDFTLSVLIRTAIGKKNKVSYYAGCGIVWDSEPYKELRELYLKIKAFNPEFSNPSI
jgi:para-aminobenzoate synthetase component 1